MTSHLHAHVSTSSRDCDGPMYREYVESLNDDEIAEHTAAVARGYNDFHALSFKARMMSNAAFFDAEFGATVRITPEGFTYHEDTDEGFTAREVEWCYRDDCDPKAYRQRDVFAEQMGY